MIIPDRWARQKSSGGDVSGGGEVEVGDVDRTRADAGSVTVEAAIALAVLALVLLACLAGVACVIAQIRCADAAREAARLAGRGDSAAAAGVVGGLAPDGAVLNLAESGDLVTATVTVRAIGGLLPGITIRATAAAAREPGL